MMDNSDDKVFLAHIDDLIRKAEEGGYVTFTDFLDEHKQSLLTQSVRRLSICMESSGGYQGAERIIAAFYAPAFEEYLSSSIDELFDQEISLVKITFADRRFLEKIPGHRDFLGAIMGTGIKREKVGDIVLSEDGAYVFVLAEMADHLIRELTSVGRALVNAQIVNKALMPAPAKGKEEVVSVSSMRLDALVSRGFRMGRTEAVKLIRAGLVFRSGSPCLDPDRQVQEGEKLTLRGHGRMIIREIRGVSKSGRTQVLLELFGKE